MPQQEARASSTAQEAFRATIEAGYYPGVDDRGSCYMCYALGEALDDGIITEDQYSAGRVAIDDVIVRSGQIICCMASAMLGCRTSYETDQEWAVEHGVNLYMNWDERAPTLEFPEWTDGD